MKNITLSIICLLMVRILAFSDGLIIPTYACPKQNIEVAGLKWIAHVGEVYVLDGYDKNSLSYYPPKPDPQHPGSYIGTPTAYILRMGNVTISVPIDSVSIIPPENKDYEKASKIYDDCVKKIAPLIAQAQADDPYVNPDATQSSGQQQNNRNIWRRGSSLNPNPPATGDEATQQKLNEIIRQQDWQRMMNNR